jgi:endoglycosylceramidase
MNNISVVEDRFVDSHGRHVILNGINLVHKGDRKNGVMNYIGPWTEEDFKKFRQWGFNVVRLGLIWDAVEPEPGKYNEKYLGWVEGMLDLCEKYGIYAFLDMHQDLYSVLYSDGAPEWATITDGQPHVEGDLWSDGYIFSEAVKRAFDNFWANAPAPDGKGLQDHYADMWVHIASRYANHPAFMGYDFMNEPFPGSESTMIFGTLMGACAEILNQFTGSQYTLEDMITAFSDQQKKFEVLQAFENKEMYMAVVQAVEPLVEKFDKGALDSFYRKLSKGVRAVDKNGIIMRENSYFSNIGVMCKAHPIFYEDGTREPLQTFSPHGYDLVVDTEAIIYASNNRVGVIFEAHRRSQERMGVPVIVGEWGAHGHYTQGLTHIEHLLSLFEDYLWSNTYWCYHEDFDNVPVLEVLKRPYPQAVCGQLLSYGYNRSAKIFNMTWDETGCSAPTIIYMPQKELEVKNTEEYSIELTENSARLIIPPKGGKRNLTISLL